jgi:polyvinyl alcohol dehydrogenase (cytochrome)
MYHITFVVLVALMVGTQAHHDEERALMVSGTAAATPQLLLRDTLKEKGQQLYITHCYSCHKDSVTNIAPGLAMMRAMSTRSIVAALNNGKMRAQGAALSAEERVAVAQWITNTKLKETSFPDSAFTQFSISPKTNSPYDHSGWGNDKPGSGFRSASQAGISAENVGSLKLKWAFAFPEATIMRTKPAVAGDWLIVGGQFGDVISIHRKTGKMGWRFAASAAIRGAITIERSGNNIIAYFADYSTNVYALDVKTGKLIWNKRAGYEPQSSVTGSVAVYNGIVYVPISSIEVGLVANSKLDCCFSSGGVVALDANTGKQIWQYRTSPKAVKSGVKRNGVPAYGPSGAPVWCSPTIDAKRGRLYIGTGQNYSYPATNTSDAIIALDLKTGKVIWRFQATEDDTYNVACPLLYNCPDKAGPDVDFGMAPILVKRQDGTEILVAGQKSGVMHALSTDGNVLWQTRVGRGGPLGGIHWGMATDGKYIYAANSDHAYTVDRRDSSHPIAPGIYALDINDGKIVWHAAPPDCGTGWCLNGNSAAPLVVPGVVFAGHLDGYIRAYDSENGKVLWQYNTVREYETINGIKGKGGSIDGPPPVVADGMLYVNSGYGMFGQAPGNVLLAFEIEKMP